MTHFGAIRFNPDLLDFFPEGELTGNLANIWSARLDPVRWRTEQLIARRFVHHVEFGRDRVGRVCFTGFLSVQSKHGSEHGPFTIKIVYPPRFPDAGVVPSVYLMSHRDRWKSGHDSHIEPDWKLCLFIAGESGIDFRRIDSLGELLATTVVFLRKEVMYQRDLERELSGGPRAVWPGEDRAHGTKGLAQAVGERGGVGHKEPCICGSGSLFGDCCSRRIEGWADGEADKLKLTEDGSRLRKSRSQRRRESSEGRR